MNLWRVFWAAASSAIAAMCAAAPPKPKLVYDGAFLIPSPDTYAGVALSPDGRRIAVTYGSEDEKGRYAQDVYVIDTRKPKRQKLVLRVGKVTGAAWSPDGRTLAVASEDGLTLLYSSDFMFRNRFSQRLKAHMRTPMVFSERGDWLFGLLQGDGAQTFESVRFDKLPAPVVSRVHLENTFAASLIRHTDNRIAVVGEGIAVDKSGREYRVRPAGTMGLYNVHSDPVIAGRWFVTFDMDIADMKGDEVVVASGARAWLEDVLTGRRIRLNWSRKVRVNWVRTTGPYSICVQTDSESLVGGRFDRFRRYRVVWPKAAKRRR